MRGTKIGRRRFLLGGVALAGSIPSSLQAASSGWPAATPAETGFAPDLADRVDTTLRKWRDDNVHAVMVIRRGRLVLERYFAGQDGGRGLVSFTPETLHDMRSVSKSVTSLLYGIALAQGKVPAPDQPLLAQFPEYPDLAADPKRHPILIEHALTMTLGMEWDEVIPYTNPANGEVAMEQAPDRYRFILDRPIVSAPGGGWRYSGGATQLLGRLIAKGTGQSLPDFARAALFDPLGIGETEWRRGNDGEPRAASGLRLRPRDLARIGQTILNAGLWEGRRVLPASWLKVSFYQHVSRAYGRRYGYQWWLGEEPIKTATASRMERSISARGNGGQRLFLFPGLELMVVVTAGNYDMPMQGAPGSDILNAVLWSL